MCIPLKKNSSITISEIIPIFKMKIPKGFIISWGSLFFFFLNQGTVSFNLENHQQEFSRTSPTLQTTAGLLSTVIACILPKHLSWWGKMPPDIWRVRLFHINYTTQRIRYLNHQSTRWEPPAFVLKLKGLPKCTWLANKGKQLKTEDTMYFFPQSGNFPT